MTTRSRRIGELIRSVLVGAALLVALGAANLAGLRTGWSQDALLLLSISETAAIVLAAALYFTARRTSGKLESVERWLDGFEDVAFIGAARDGEIRTWTPGAVKVTGLQASEVMRCSFTCLFSPEDQSSGIPADLLRIAAGNGSAEHSAWACRPDGSRYWAHYVVKAIRGELRSVRGYSIVICDETARKLSEDHIADQHRLLETIVNGTFDVIYLKDRDGRYRLVNAAGALAFGRRRDEIQGRCDYELFDAETCRRHSDSDRAVMESGEPHVYEEETVVGSTPRTYLTHKTAWHDHEGNVIGVIVIATDITERRRRETTERSLAEYRHLFIEAPVAYHEIDGNGVIRKVNRMGCELLGRQSSEVIGRPVWRFVAPHERSEAVAGLHRAMAGQAEQASFERTYVRPDGTPVRVELHETPIIDEYGNTVGLRSALVASRSEFPATLDRSFANSEGIAAVV